MSIIPHTFNPLADKKYTLSLNFCSLIICKNEYVPAKILDVIAFWSSHETTADRGGWHYQSYEGLASELWYFPSKSNADLIKISRAVEKLVKWGFIEKYRLGECPKEILSSFSRKNLHHRTVFFRFKKEAVISAINSVGIPIKNEIKGLLSEMNEDIHSLESFLSDKKGLLSCKKEILSDKKEILSDKKEDIYKEEIPVRNSFQKPFPHPIPKEGGGGKVFFEDVSFEASSEAFKGDIANSDLIDPELVKEAKTNSRAQVDSLPLLQEKDLDRISDIANSDSIDPEPVKKVKTNSRDRMGSLPLPQEKENSDQIADLEKATLEEVSNLHSYLFNKKCIKVSKAELEANGYPQSYAKAKIFGWGFRLGEKEYLYPWRKSKLAYDYEPRVIEYLNTEYERCAISEPRRCDGKTGLLKAEQALESLYKTIDPDLVKHSYDSFVKLSVHLSAPVAEGALEGASSPVEAPLSDFMGLTSSGGTEDVVEALINSTAPLGHKIDLPIKPVDPIAPPPQQEFKSQAIASESLSALAADASLSDLTSEPAPIGISIGANLGYKGQKLEPGSILFAYRYRFAKPSPRKGYAFFEPIIENIGFEADPVFREICWQDIPTEFLEFEENKPATIVPLSLFDETA